MVEVMGRQCPGSTGIGIGQPALHRVYLPRRTHGVPDSLRSIQGETDHIHPLLITAIPTPTITNRTKSQANPGHPSVQPPAATP